MAIVGFALLTTLVIVDDRGTQSDPDARAGHSDWTRLPTELFTARGEVVAASQTRWMFAAPAGQGEQYRYSIKDEAGKTVGVDFDAGFRACARTWSGVLGCQIGSAFYLVDMASGERRRTEASANGGQPIALADGWVLGDIGHQRVVTVEGTEKWRIPADETVVEAVAPTVTRIAPLVVTSPRNPDRRLVRDASSGRVLAECDCLVTLFAAGFATSPINMFATLPTDGVTTVYTTSGAVVDMLKHGATVIAGASRTLYAEPIGNVDASLSPYRVRTPDGRVVWQGSSTNGPPRGCGSWIMADHGAIAVADGEMVAPATGSSTLEDCVGFSDEWAAKPDGMVVTDGRSWQPSHGYLDMVDGMLVNRIVGDITVVYSPTTPAPAPLAELTAQPTFTTKLEFTHTPAGTLSNTDISRVTYAAGRWTVGADELTQEGKATARHPAEPTFTLSEDGTIVATGPPQPVIADPCGPYSVTLADNPANVMVQRTDGKPVAIGAQPDPEHIVAAGAQCVGFSEHHLALTLRGERGLTLLPVDRESRALRLPYATGFAAGRPFAVDNEQETLTVYPAVGAP